VVIKQQLG
jgi:hypothetical protein